MYLYAVGARVFVLIKKIEQNMTRSEKSSSSNATKTASSFVPSSVVIIDINYG